MKVLVYSYNPSLKECVAPDDYFLNLANVIGLEVEPRPLMGDKVFYRIYLANRETKNVNEEDGKKIIKRIE